MKEKRVKKIVRRKGMTYNKKPNPRKPVLIDLTPEMIELIKTMKKNYGYKFQYSVIETALELLYKEHKKEN